MTAAHPRLPAWAVLWTAFGLGPSGCMRAPPPSQFPTARAAIERMRDTHACSRGIQGESKVDYYGKAGRIRGNILFVTSRPESVRLDVFSPFGATLSTLTSNGTDFAFLDVREKVFFAGPANECNIRRFLNVPVPAQALARLLTGEAPVLVHEPGSAQIAWDGDYVIRVPSRHGASQRIRLEPNPDDWARPYSEQRVRVLEVVVEQQGVVLYRVELGHHEPAPTAEPRQDPDGIEADIPPSGPECNAEVPRRIRFVTPVSGQDVLFRHKKVVHNPPLVPGLFRQVPPAGVRVREAFCSG